MLWSIEDMKIHGDVCMETYKSDRSAITMFDLFFWLSREQRKAVKCCDDILRGKV